MLNVATAQLARRNHLRAEEDSLNRSTSSVGAAHYPWIRGTVVSWPQFRGLSIQEAYAAGAQLCVLDQPPDDDRHVERRRRFQVDVLLLVDASVVLEGVFDLGVSFTLTYVSVNIAISR